ISAKRTFVARLWPLSRIARRMLASPHCGLESRERRLVLPCRLANRSTDHDLEDLVFAEAGESNRRDVIVGDVVCLLGNLVDQPAHRPCYSRVVKGGAAHGR